MKKSLPVVLLAAILLSITPVCADNSERAGVYYNNGMTYFKDKKYSSAILEFKKVIRQKPYDKTVQNAIAMAYLARAQYYIDTEKAYKKAINDLRSALTYFKYWDNDPIDDSKQIAVQKAENNLSYLTRMYAPISTGEQISNEAKALRAQGEFAAAIYEFAQLYKTNVYGKLAYSTNSDIYKSLSNQKMAIESIRNAISRDNNDGTLHFKYALILDSLGNEDAAMDEYSKAMENANKNAQLLDELQNLWMARSVQDPKDSQALINLGAILQKKGEFELAKAQYIKARQINPNDPVALINLASVYTELKDYDSAIRIYDEILAKNPSDLSARFYKGKLYESKNDTAHAIEQYKGILALKANDANAQNALNAILSNLTGEKLTGYLYSEAINNPSNYDAQFKYAFEMHKNKAYAAAVEFYKKCIALRPENPEPYINIAQIYIEGENLEKANNIINQGLSNISGNQKLLELKDTISKTHANNMYAKGSELFNKGQYKEALEFYSKIQYQTPEILTMIGNCYFELKDADNAIKYYNKVLEKDPKNEKALTLIANQLIAMKKEDQARVYINHILSINPNNKDAKNMLAVIKEGEEGILFETAVSAYEAKDYTTALDNLNKLISLNPKNVYAYYYKGVISDDNGKTAEAIEQYKKAITIDPNFSLCYYMLAVAFDTKEDYKSAVTYYDKFIQLKTKEGAQDEFLTYAQTRTKELKEYLSQQ